MRLSTNTIPSRWPISACLATSMVGCATVDNEPLDVPVVIPAQWEHEAKNINVENEGIADTWWLAFEDAELSALIVRAYDANPDLAATAQSVIQADIALKNASAGLLPSFSAAASTGRQAQQVAGSSTMVTGSSTSASLSLDYEVDLWGRLAATEASALASLQATRFDFEAARLTLAGSVATIWFQLLETRQRLDIARQNLETAERTLQLVDARYRNGVADRSELARQQTALLVRRNAIPPLEYQIRQNLAALRVLTGDFPYGGETPAAQFNAITVPSIDPGLPANIITQRPDLAADEARLQAANADIRQTRAALLPRLSLGAAARLSSDGFLSLADPTRAVTGLLSLSQTLFDGGQQENATALSQSRRVALLQTYRGNLLTAFRETGDALDRVTLFEEQERRLVVIREQAEQTLRLTEIRYREGSDDLLTLLETQRSLFDAREQITRARLDRLLASVDLFKALGGGLVSKRL